MFSVFQSPGLRLPEPVDDASSVVWDIRAFVTLYLQKNQLIYLRL
jgi:hypothetical protein